MATTLTVRDVTSPALDATAFVFTLALASTQITVRELIRARVYQEVADYNARLPEFYHGLVQPALAERTLNGYRLPRGHKIDCERQFERAVEAFERSSFIILVDDRQVSGLDERIEIGPAASVTFLKLVPLAGG